MKTNKRIEKVFTFYFLFLSHTQVKPEELNPAVNYIQVCKNIFFIYFILN